MTFLHPLSFRILALGASLTVGAASIAHAVDLTQSTSPPSQNGATAGDGAVNSAQTALELANAHAENVSSQLDAVRQQVKQTRERLTRADRALPEIKTRIEEATNRFDARRQEMAVADTRYAPLKFADDKVRLDAIGEFEKSKEYRASLQAVTDSATTLRATEAESMRRLATSDEYHQAWNAMQAADAAVNAAGRQFPADSPQVAEATKAAADAHARLDALKDRRLASDPNVQIAQTRLTAAKAGVDAMRSKFMEQELPQNPKVAVADKALAAEQAEYDKTSGAAKDAEKQLADARAALDRQNAGLAADRTALDGLTDKIMQLQNGLASAQAQVSDASDALNRAVTNAQAAEEARESAAIVAQRQASPVLIYPSTTYQYQPPAVIYPQPPAYGAAPLHGYYGGYGGYGGYGTFLVVPSRGFGNGFNGNRGFQGHADFHHEGHESHDGHAAHGGGHR